MVTKFVTVRLLLVFLLVVVGACAQRGDSNPTILRVSALPDQRPEVVRARNAPLLKHVCESVGIECQWVDSSSYTDLVDRFGRGEVELAFFGGVTYVLARRQHAAVPLVMRDIDARFTSGIFVRAADPASTLQDLRGYSFGFGNLLSTSGHYMPRYYLRREGIEPEIFFGSVSHSLDHYDTLARLSRGEIDACAVNMDIARQFMETASPDVKLLWETPPYADYVWAVQPDMSDELRLQLRDAFLSLTRKNPAERDILARQGARGFLPATAEDFSELESIMKTIQ